jgi:hypothetical protein
VVCIVHWHWHVLTSAWSPPGDWHSLYSIRLDKMDRALCVGFQTPSKCRSKSNCVNPEMFCHFQYVDTLESLKIQTTETHSSGPWIICQRPYHAECTGSRQITEVKQRRAWIVLGWETAWEHQVLLAFVFAVVNIRIVFCIALSRWLSSTELTDGTHAQLNFSMGRTRHRSAFWCSR